MLRKMRKLHENTMSVYSSLVQSILWPPVVLFVQGSDFSIVKSFNGLEMGLVVSLGLFSILA